MSPKYTPLPVAKWTNSSIIKHNDSMWSNLLKGILDDDELSKGEKNRRLDIMLEWFKMVEYNCMNNLLTIKKILNTN